MVTMPSWRARATTLWPRLWFLFPLLAGLLTCRSQLRFGFVADAQLLIADNRFIEGFRRIWPNLRHDYFYSSAGSAIPYWRPLTKLSWVLEATLAGKRPMLFHAVQIAWFLVAIGGVMRLARELGLRRRYALCAAMAFAVHGANAEPVSLLMARSDVVATACSLWALALFRAYLRTGRRGALVGHTVFFVLALASKEVALALVPVAATWLALEHRARSHFRSLLPMLAVAAVYLVLRRLAIGSIASLSMTFDPLRIFVGGGLSIASLGQLGPTTGLRSVVRAEALSPGALAISALAWGVLLAAGVLGLGERRRGTTALTLWALASIAMILLPSSTWVPNVVGKIALADRWLMPALAAATIVAARFAQRLLRGRAATVFLVVFFGWVSISIAWASVVRASYANEETMLDLEDRAYAETPERYRSQEDRCRIHDRAVVRALARGDAQLAMSEDDKRPVDCARSTWTLHNRLAALVALHRFVEARAAATVLLARTDLEPRQYGSANYLAGVAELESGDPAVAEADFARAGRYGFSACSLPLQSARAAMALGRPSDAARRLEVTFDCVARSGRGDPNLLLAAADIFMQIGDTAEAARLRARAAQVGAR